MHIYILGDPQDLTAVYVAWLARQKMIEVIELAEDTLGIDWKFSFDDTQSNDGYIEIGDGKNHFTETIGAFVRLNPDPALPSGLDLSSAESYAFVAERRGAIQHLLDSVPFTVVNRPLSGRSNGSKPYQMNLLTAAGLQVPAWIASNDKSEIKAFAELFDGMVVYKSCSGLRSRVRLLDAEVFDRLSEGTTPIIVQEYIEGRNVRVHTVRNQVFPTSIVGGGIDYRFDQDVSTYSATTVPKQLGGKCCSIANSEGLVIAGFDFCVTHDNQWYCLEMNPVPTFLPYEMSTGQPIGDAVLNAMIGNKST